MSTLAPEAQYHQGTLQSTTQAFLATMQSDGHDQSKYEHFIKNMKFLLDNHISDLKGQQVKDVTKMVMNIIWDPDCKHLRPKESTIESSDEIWETRQRHHHGSISWHHADQWGENKSDQLSGLHGAVTHASNSCNERGEKTNAKHPSQCLQTVTPRVTPACHQIKGSTCLMHHQDTQV